MPRVPASAKPRYVPLKEAAAYANIPIKSMRDWIRRGLIPAYRIGPRLIQIDLNDIDRMRRRIPTARRTDDERAAG